MKPLRCIVFCLSLLVKFNRLNACFRNEVLEYDMIPDTPFPICCVISAGMGGMGDNGKTVLEPTLRRGVGKW